MIRKMAGLDDFLSILLSRQTQTATMFIAYLLLTHHCSGHQGRTVSRTDVVPALVDLHSAEDKSEILYSVYIDTLSCTFRQCRSAHSVLGIMSSDRGHYKTMGGSLNFRTDINNLS